MTSSYYNHSSNNSTTPSFNMFIKIRDLKEQPLDSVQCLINDPSYVDEHRFLVAGWDGIVRYYRFTSGNTDQKIQLLYQRFLQHPIISICINRQAVVFAGLATGQIVAVNMATNQSGIIGSHDAPICKVFWIQKYSVLISLGFDYKLKFWSASNNGINLEKQFQLPFKTHTAAFDFPYLLIGTADSKVGFVKLDNLQNFKITENGFFDFIQMGSKIQCSKIVAQKKMFAIGCVDGRCCMSTFQQSYQGQIRPNPNPSSKLVSKSQKRQLGYGNSNNAYSQANDIEIGIQDKQQYYVITGTQEIAFYNVRRKQKVKRIKGKYTCGILSLDGRYFIFAQGNDWNEGISDFKKPTIPKIQAVKFYKTQIQSFVAGSSR